MMIIKAVEYIVGKAKEVKSALGGLGGGAIDLFTGGGGGGGDSAPGPLGGFKQGFQDIQNATNPQAPVINVPTTESAGGNSFQASIQIDGSKDPAATARAVNDALDNFWHGQMRKAAAQSGSNR